MDSHEDQTSLIMYEKLPVRINIFLLIYNQHHRNI